jgi:uncharacterized alkaline shock family protein YloU
MFGGAVSILWGAWSTMMVRQRNEKEKENESLREQLRVLDTENKNLAAIIIMANENAEGVQEMRKELARLLRGRS